MENKTAVKQSHRRRRGVEGRLFPASSSAEREIENPVGKHSLPGQSRQDIPVFDIRPHG